MVQLRRQIFRQSVQIPAGNSVSLLPRGFGRFDGTDASKCAIKAMAVNGAELPKNGFTSSMNP